MTQDKIGMKMEEQQKLAELMLKNILTLGKFSYSLQEKREESLISQSGRMLTAYSVTAALLPLLLSKTAGLGPAILFTGLLISFIFALIAGWRFKSSFMPSIDVFYDEVYGEITVDNNTLDEGVLLKSDGYPTYNFANIVDDHLMHITHVIRGNEYLSSTPKYNLIYQAFNWEIPTYIHVPPVMKDEQHKLSKRNGDASYQDLVKQGYLSEAIINYLALLGWAPEGEEEIFSLDELIKQFDVKRISKAPAIFDLEKLKWLNGIYLRKLSLEEFHQLAMPYYQRLIHRNVDLMELSKVLQLRISYLAEIESMIDFIDEPCKYDAGLFKNKKMKTNLENSLEALLWIQEKLIDFNSFDDDEKLHQLFVNLAKEKEVKNGRIMFPLRVALTFKAFTPGGAVEIAHILGKEETLRRIDLAIKQMSA